MSELFPLRPLQVRAMEGLKQSLRTGHKRPVIQASCGFGKTVLSAHIVDGALRKGNRVAFVAPMISLIDQTFARFVANGIKPADMGVMQANHAWTRPDAPLQVCSVQTLAMRSAPDVTFAVIDEAHLSYKVVAEWMAAHPEMIFVGLSATPWTRGMGDQWDDLVRPTTLPELTAEKWLTPIRAYAPNKPDMSDVKIVAGEYHQGQAAEKMSNKAIVGDVVSTWIEKGENRPTLAFAVDRAHARILEAEFTAAGVGVAYVDAYTKPDERQAIFRQLRREEIRVIASIGTMIVGIDEDIRCISWARPTKSDMLFVQALGRGMRPAEGKTDCVLLDHAGTALDLGLPEEIEARHPRLHSKQASREEEKREREPEPARPKECPECSALIPVRAECCPGCGFKPKRVSRVEVQEGELIEIGGAGAGGKKKLSPLHFYRELKGYAEERGYQQGWVLNKFREKTGNWPPRPWKYEEAAICSPKVRSWIKASQIRWMKGRAKGRVREQIEDAATDIG